MYDWNIVKNNISLIKLLLSMVIKHLKRPCYMYIMFGSGICEKYQSRDEKFHEPKGEGNLVSRLVFFANTLYPSQTWYICLITPNII
jgi:hypothetical protein